MTRETRSERRGKTEGTKETEEHRIANCEANTGREWKRKKQKAE